MIYRLEHLHFISVLRILLDQICRHQPCHPRANDRHGLFGLFSISHDNAKAIITARGEQLLRVLDLKPPRGKLRLLTVIVCFSMVVCDFGWGLFG